MPPSSPSHSTDSKVGTSRRPILEDDVTISRHSTIRDRDPGVSTEDVKLEAGNPPVVSSSDEDKETIKYFVFSI